MNQPALSRSTRIRATPYTARAEAAGVQGYMVYNHMLLPIGYTDSETAYWHLREHVQIWDVSCERQVEIRGPDAARLVQLMTPRNLSRLAVGRCAYAPLADEYGGMVNDPVLLKLSEDHFWLSIGDSDVLLWAKGLACGLGLEVILREPDVSPLAVQGPKAETVVARVFGEAVRDIRFFRFAWLAFQGHPLLVARSGWSKQGGFEIYLDRFDLGEALWDAVWAAGQDQNIAPGAPHAIERIEGGLLSYGGDMDLAHNPLECGLEAFCELSQPLECLSQAALRRVAQEGIRRRIMGLKIQADGLPPCLEYWPVSGPDGETVGRVSSAMFSPRLRCGVAIAMLDQPFFSEGQAVWVDSPDGQYPAQVVSLPMAD